MTNSDYTGGKKPHWKVASVSHSAATVAQGNAAAKVIGSAGGTLMSAAALLH